MFPKRILLAPLLALIADGSDAAVCAAPRARRAIVKEQVVVQEVVPAAVTNVFYSAGSGGYASNFARYEADLAGVQRERERLLEGYQRLLQYEQNLRQESQALYGIPFVPIDPRQLRQQQNQYGGYDQQRQQPQQSCLGAPGSDPPAAQRGAGHDPYRSPPAPDPRFSLRSPQSVTQSKCAKCHAGPDAQKNLDVTNHLTDEQRAKMLARARAGEMPNEGDPLTRAEIEQLTLELFPEFSPEQVKAIFGALTNGGP